MWIGVLWAGLLVAMWITQSLETPYFRGSKDKYGFGEYGFEHELSELFGPL